MDKSSWQFHGLVVKMFDEVYILLNKNLGKTMSLLDMNEKEIDQALRSSLGEEGNLRHDGRRKTLVILGLAVVCVLQQIGLVALVKKKDPPPNFIAVTPDGRQYQLLTKASPVFNEDQAGQWVSYALPKILNYNWTELDSHFSEASRQFFTEDAWLTFKNELDASGTFRSVVQNELISNMKFTSSPVLVAKGVQGGVDAWEFEAKGTLSYLNRTQRSDNTMKFKVAIGLLTVNGVKDYRILAFYMIKDRG
ncbi:DotI/IcmL family type IV secretion protein [Chromobacterium phragmitis]|uniref:DotI/IcmL family type IV secretion protein n=1 Tax=Chromobacterium phragmitis TaxID=2202141 RepID=UPI00143DA54B|nr:DotI/IcmL family type IV secretion protein [Chromobacterium phragmitis]